MNIFSFEIRNLRKSVLSWTLSISCVIFAMLAFFPAMENDSMKALAGAKMEGVDPTVLVALGIDQLTDFSVVTNYFGYVLQFIVLAIMVYVTQQAVSLLIKEETDGTIEYLYAKPVSRGGIFFQKYLAVVLLFIFMLTALAVVTVIGYLMFSDYTFQQSVKEAAIFYGAILFAGLVFMSVGILLSSLIKGGKSPSSITVAIVFGTFIIGIMSALIDSLDFLVYFSPMDWIKTQKLLDEGITWKEYAIGVSVIIVSTISAGSVYKKRDLLV